MLGGEHSLAIVVMATGKSMVCSGNWKKLSYDKRLVDKKKGEVQVLVWPELEDPHQSFLGQLFPAMDITGLQQKKANKQRAVELRAGKVLAGFQCLVPVPEGGVGEDRGQLLSISISCTRSLPTKY